MTTELLLEAWGPLLEILILAVGIYHVLNFMRGTRGAPVVTGFIVVLLGLTLLTVVLDLNVLRWLLGTFFVFIAVAFLVIFQPEMRRMFAQLGNQSMFQAQHEQRENLEIIVDAAENMAEAKIGCIIAIERNIQLPEVVESGVEVDCEATPEMLETIFFPNNAIHDGGVIIKEDRITHAAAIFPLTHQPNLATTMGTRHRAAIGLTEETDAAVVLVSEETGGIGYAYKGQLTRDVTPQELRSFLTSILVSRRRPKTVVDRLRRWIVKHIPSWTTVK
ncbi:MAG: TIGR00159 family protein [Verrucomicrobiales bacterium]|nr:TIGR00159 family protein [Verrucomicrobiales bacterium]|tara:strand:- start:4984 stop:5811 length:828 start_codon:yes stop_codon:yes gene_type:complete